MGRLKASCGSPLSCEASTLEEEAVVPYVGCMKGLCVARSVPHYSQLSPTAIMTILLSFVNFRFRAHDLSHVGAIRWTPYLGRSGGKTLSPSVDEETPATNRCHSFDCHGTLLHKTLWADTLALNITVDVNECAPSQVRTRKNTKCKRLTDEFHRPCRLADLVVLSRVHLSIVVLQPGMCLRARVCDEHKTNLPVSVLNERCSSTAVALWKGRHTPRPEHIDR